MAHAALQVHNVTLVVDEMDRACQGKNWISKSVRHIVHECRHERIDLFGTFRSTRNINEDLVGQSDYIFVFKHNTAAKYDIQTLSQRFGKAYAQKAPQLKTYQFLAWSDE